MPTWSEQPVSVVDEKQPKPGKRHAKGWRGTSSTSRTRKSPARASKNPRLKRTQANAPAPSPIKHDITNCFAPLRYGH